MLYLGLALICAFLGVIPLLLLGNVKRWITITTFVTCALFFWWILWGTRSSVMVEPFFGTAGLLVLAGMCVSVLVQLLVSYHHGDDLPRHILTIPLFLLVAFIGRGCVSSEIFNSGRYASLVGPMERRVWTQDVQPKDPEHMRLGTYENAIYQAGKVLGTDGAIGSQFRIAKGVTLQRINGELQYVVPLEFQRWRTWLNTKAVPAYIRVHGEDPMRQAELVQLPADKQLRYTPGAFFSHQLERHLRYSGFLNRGIASMNFEIDDDGNPWYVVSLYKPTIGWSGRKITGVVLVNPSTGEVSPETMPDKAPAWVDRIFPEDYVVDYLSAWGKLSTGWWNSVWAKKSILEPETPNLVQGADGNPVWVTGITSTSLSDQSLVDLVYTDTRTGKSVIYESGGGATDEAVIEAVNKNSQVQYLHLHGADPQVYNIQAHMASVVPLLNENHAFQQVAVVDVKNVQLVATGKSAVEAVRNFQTLINKASQTSAVDNTREEGLLEGMVSRIGKESHPNGTTMYYVYITGTPHVFSGSSSDFFVLTVTVPGDKIRMSYVASGEDVMPILKFENLYVPLRTTATQGAVRGAAENRLVNEKLRGDSAAVTENLKNLSAAELRTLDSIMKKRRKP